jgi:hypothetical protein
MNGPLPDRSPLPEVRFASLLRVGYQHCLFKIYFGEEGDTPHGDNLGVGVAMTPAFLKAMIGHLSQELRAYESRFGPVPDYLEESER